MSDPVQFLTLVVYAACLYFAWEIKMHRGYWLAFFMVIAHSVIFYVVVNSQNAGLVSGVPTMAWGLALRLHMGIVMLAYLIKKPVL